MGYKLNSNQRVENIEYTWFGIVYRKIIKGAWEVMTERQEIRRKTTAEGV